MNDRIQKFAEQSSILRKGCSPIGLQREQLEKFAELVAKYVVKRVADLGAIDVNGEIAKTVIQEFSVPL